MCVYYSEQAEMFESALDKACKLLAMNEEMSTIDCSYHSQEQWKQWILKNLKGNKKGEINE